LRSFPFIILMILLFPLSRLIVGTSIEPQLRSYRCRSQPHPLSARIIESAVKEVDPGVIQAPAAMGSTTMQVIRKFLIPEAMPALVSESRCTIINLIGYSAMGRAIGGGGLGDLAIRYGTNDSAPCDVCLGGRDPGPGGSRSGHRKQYKRPHDGETLIPGWSEGGTAMPSPFLNEVGARA
jgi:ABC-type methionine transport system permease subunit